MSFLQICLKNGGLAGPLLEFPFNKQAKPKTGTLNTAKPKLTPPRCFQKTWLDIPDEVACSFEPFEPALFNAVSALNSGLAEGVKHRGFRAPDRRGRRNAPGVSK